MTEATRKTVLVKPFHLGNGNSESPESSMKDQPHDPNDELQTSEPLRITLAIGALLLGLLMGLH